MRGSGERSQVQGRRAEGTGGWSEPSGTAWCRHARTPEWPGRHRLLPHLAALLVMKADHHDVQDGPRGAIAAPPDLHGRTPRACTTMTQPPRAASSATPRSPGGRREVDFRCQRGSRMRAAQGAGRRPPTILQLCTALGRGRASSSGFPLFPPSPDAGPPRARRDWADREGPDGKPGLMAGRGL